MFHSPASSQVDGWLCGGSVPIATTTGTIKNQNTHACALINMRQLRHQYQENHLVAARPLPCMFMERVWSGDKTNPEVI